MPELREGGEAMSNAKEIEDALKKAFEHRCDHNPAGGTLVRVSGTAYRCSSCGKLFAVGSLRKAVER